VVEWRWEEGGGASGPEIDAREKSIYDLQTKRIQTRQLQRNGLGNVLNLNKCLSRPSACVQKVPRQRNMGKSRGRTYALLRLQVLRAPEV
jgi:hypothetical protein